MPVHHVLSEVQPGPRRHDRLGNEATRDPGDRMQHEFIVRWTDLGDQGSAGRRQVLAGVTDVRSGIPQCKESE